MRLLLPFLALGLAMPAMSSAASVAPRIGGMWTLNQDDFDHQRGIAPPYSPEAQAIVAAAHKATLAGKVLGDGQKKCQPNGMPSMMLTEFALEIIESEGRVTIVSESSPLVRTVYLNRTGPSDGLEPMWNGYSTGKWNGDTLVVRTTNINDKAGPIVFGGAVHAPTTTITERLSVSADGTTLTDAMTLDDKRYLTAPWTLVRHYTRLPIDAELWEYACEIDAPGWSERYAGEKAETPNK